jgi:hypothetical protein
MPACRADSSVASPAARPGNDRFQDGEARLHQSCGGAAGNQLTLAARPGALPHRAEVVLNGADRYPQMVGDLLAGQAPARQSQHLGLPGGQGHRCSRC